MSHTEFRLSALRLVCEYTPVHAYPLHIFPLEVVNNNTPIHAYATFFVVVVNFWAAYMQSAMRWRVCVCNVWMDVSFDVSPSGRVHYQSAPLSCYYAE